MALFNEYSAAELAAVPETPPALILIELRAVSPSRARAKQQELNSQAPQMRGFFSRPRK